MRNYGDQTRFEKEMTTEPNKVGEFPPALGDQTKGWDSLKEVPFRGNQNAFAQASTKQSQRNDSVQSNAFSKATQNIGQKETKTNAITQQRSR